MEIILLASNAELYSNKRIMEAAEAANHNIRFLNVRDCYMNITASKPEVHLRGGKIITKVDAIIPRIKPSLTFYGSAVVRQFELMGAYCLNNSLSITRSRDKLRSLQIFSKNGIDMPITGFANSPQDTKDLIKVVGGAPLIVKVLESTQGVGVVLAETNKAAESVINAFKSLKANILVQAFVKESAGEDLRLFVIGDKVLTAMKRTAAEGEFRSNMHRGGTASSVKITPAERKMAVSAAKLLGLDVAGVDIIRSDTGPKILEVNSSPGLEGIEKASGKKIAEEMIRHIEKTLHKKPKRIIS